MKPILPILADVAGVLTLGALVYVLAVILLA